MRSAVNKGLMKTGGRGAACQRRGGESTSVLEWRTENVIGVHTRAVRGRIVFP